MYATSFNEKIVPGNFIPPNYCPTKLRYFSSSMPGEISPQRILRENSFTVVLLLFALSSSIFVNYGHPKIFFFNVLI